MSAPAWVKDLLRGGLPEVLDLGDSAGNGVQTPTPERVPPADVTDRERANPTGAMMGISTEQVLTIGVVVVGGILLVNLMRR